MNGSDLLKKQEAFAAHLLFWGRTPEIGTLRKRLLSNQPQNCVIIGETSFGKTTLLQTLADPHYKELFEDEDLHERFSFIYFDCNLYKNLANMTYGRRGYASAQFWWDLYVATLRMLNPDQQPEISRPEWKNELKQGGGDEAENKAKDEAYEIKNELESIIRKHRKQVVIILDNFEGVASLPLRDSEWLRSMIQRQCSLIVSGRYRLHILYHPEGEPLLNVTTSPLWNLFSDPIYLGLVAESDVEVFLGYTYQLAGEAGSIWEPEDIECIRKNAGRHPRLLNIACHRLYEWRLHPPRHTDRRGDEALWFNISLEANPICQQLWQSLKDKELEYELRRIDGGSGEENRSFSAPQKELIAIANGRTCAETDVTYILEQRGLIEWVDGCWHVFSEIMRQFVLKQEAINCKNVQSGEPAAFLPAFTKLEGQVYDFLLEKEGKVCSKEEIKNAIWQGKKIVPGDSALQKIIERIREKLENDADHAQYLLIAVRGQGYMLRRNMNDDI